ncbi:C-C motif chemokine 3-like [Megalobrama amblycephala]|uniref:C-C motif chemokine 3-like n=1 Tax=Megalobrama amblycephala TaxID=75352 RepID=UPI0020147D2B|nr:C-C motif chemokine 3-like [Megalobrama amblycephala]
MRPCCNFICLILFDFCSLAHSEYDQGPDKCCFSFSNVRIPVKQVASYHITHFECHSSGIIFITKAQKEICADPTERWVQRLKNLVDARTIKENGEESVNYMRMLY